MDQSMFIKSISTDDENRITVSVQESFQTYLADETAKKMLRETATKALGEDFVQLEVSSTTFRITVAEGTVERSTDIIKTEIASSIEMALNFFNQFNG